MASLVQLYKDMESSLERMEIPPCPGVLDQIFAESRQEEPDFMRLAALISEDMALAASLIKTVNSPYFGLQRRATSVQEALMLLGLELAARMVAGILLRHSFPRRADLDALWDASIKVAVMSQWLAVRLGRGLGVRPADAYTFGLFRDCGMAILQLHHKDYPAAVLHARAEADEPFTAAEQAALGLNHAVVGAKLANEWRLSETLAWAILMHHAIAGPLDELDDAQGLRLIAVAQIADKLLQDNGQLAADHEWDKLGARCLEILNLDAPAYEGLAEAAGLFIVGELPRLLP